MNLKKYHIKGISIKRRKKRRRKRIKTDKVSILSRFVAIFSIIYMYKRADDMSDNLTISEE